MGEQIEEFEEMDKVIFREMIEHDLIVSILPKKSYDIQVRIESIEQGKPIIDNSIIDN